MTAAAAVETVDGSAATGPAVDAGAVPVRRHTTVATELGELTLVGEGAELVGVYFPDHRPEPDATRFGEAVEVTDDPVLAAASEQLAAYVSGHRTTVDVPVRADGSERARQVWDLVAAVPRGETTTYAALGRAVGVGPRVAGQMVARNPLCVVVPCHRVVASDGRLTGYAGGVDRKRQLLQLEGALAAGAVKASPGPGSGPPETSTAAEVDG